MLWSLTGTVFPLAIFTLLWLMGARGVLHLPFALAGIGLAMAFAGATEWFYRDRPAGDDETDGATPLTSLPINTFAAAGCSALLFAFAAGLSGLPLTLALMVTLPALSAVANVRQVWALRVAVPAFGSVLALHVVYSLTGLPDAVGPRIIFNALWVYLALPAVASGAASWLLARPLSDKWSQAMEALALAFAALFAVFQVRHYMNAGDLFAPKLTLEELSLQTWSACVSRSACRVSRILVHAACFQSQRWRRWPSRWSVWCSATFSP